MDSSLLRNQKTDPLLLSTVVCILLNVCSGSGNLSTLFEDILHVGGDDSLTDHRHASGAACAVDPLHFVYNLIGHELGSLGELPG